MISVYPYGNILIMEKANIIVFGDPVGRLLIGERVGETDAAVEVANPLVVDARLEVDDQTGEQKQGIQFVPCAYLELFNAEGGSWFYPKSTYAFNTLTTSDQAKGLYERVVDMYISSKLDMSKGQIVAESNEEIKLVD